MKRKTLGWILGSVFLVCFLTMTVVLWISIFQFDKTNTPYQDSLTRLQWFYEGEAISLPENLDVEKGEAFTITATLPQDVSEIPVMMMRSSKQSVKVAIDGQVVYIYDTDGIRMFGKTNYSRWHFLEITSDMAGKEISITLQSPLKSSSGKTYEVEFGTNVALFQYICWQHLPQMMVGVFVLCTGLFVSVSSGVFLKRRWEQRAQTFLGVAALFLGIWLVFESKVIGLFVNEQLVYLATYIALMMFALFFASYIRLSTRDKWAKPFAKALEYVSALNLVTEMALYMLGWAELTDLNVLTNVIILLEAIVYCVPFFINFRKSKKSPNFVTRVVGVVIALTSFLVEYVLFYVFNVFLPTGLISGLGFLVFLTVVHASTVVRTIYEAEKGYVAEKELEKTKRYLMFSQRRPHFIFNTLAAIRALIVSEPKVAYDMTTNFSKYLRSTMDVENVDTIIPFAKELALIRAYVDIEKVRFRDRLAVEYKIDESNFSVPSMTIQPLMENAIKHGICKKLEGGKIVLSTYRKGDNVCVEIVDDGVGFNVEHLITKPKDEVAGLKNIKIRLQDAVGATLEINSQEGIGTRVLVTFKGEER